MYIGFGMLGMFVCLVVLVYYWVSVGELDASNYIYIISNFLWFQGDSVILVSRILKGTKLEFVFEI